MNRKWLITMVAAVPGYGQPRTEQYVCQAETLYAALQYCPQGMMSEDIIKVEEIVEPRG